MEATATLVRSRVGDLPDWLGPMQVRELRQALRAPLFLVSFVAVHAVAMIALLVEFAWLRSEGSERAQYLDFPGESTFWGIVTVVLAVVLPFRCFGVLHSEMKVRNIELVLMSGLLRWRIVFSQWLIQMSLTVLIFVSLLPYIIVRYFFGGVEVVETAVTSVSVLGAAAAANALVLGASGYGNLPFRVVLLAFGAFILLSLGGMGTKGILDFHTINTGDFFHLLVFLYFMLCLGLFFAFYTMVGLQLSRAHLKSCVRPFDVKPTRLIVTILIISPFFIGVGSVITCFYGIGLILGLMVWWIWSADLGFTRD